MQVGFGETDVVTEYKKYVAENAILEKQLQEVSDMEVAATAAAAEYHAMVEKQREDAIANREKERERNAKLREQLSQKTLSLDSIIESGIGDKREVVEKFVTVVDDDYLKTLDKRGQVAVLVEKDMAEMARVKLAQEHDKLCNEELPARMQTIASDMAASRPSWKVSQEFRWRISGVQKELDEAGVTKPDASCRKQLRSLWAQFDAFKDRCPAENALQRELKKINGGGKKNAKV